MSSYVLVAIWVLSHIVCVYLAKKRNVELNAILRIIGVCLGPLAIPLVFALKPKPSQDPL